MSDLGCSTRNTSVNFDPSNLENFQAPSVDPLPRSDMNLCDLSQSRARVLLARLGCTERSARLARTTITSTPRSVNDVEVRSISNLLVHQGGLLPVRPRAIERLQVTSQSRKNGRGRLILCGKNQWKSMGSL